MGWREYHELTKHSVESLRRTQHHLDWANMPDPFRYYEGVPVLDLPADPPAPQISALEVLEGKTGNTLARDGARFLSQFSIPPRSARPSQSPPPELSALCASIPLSVISIRPNFTTAHKDWPVGPMASIITVPHPIASKKTTAKWLVLGVNWGLPKITLTFKFRLAIVGLEFECEPSTQGKLRGIRQRTE